MWFFFGDFLGYGNAKTRRLPSNTAQKLWESLDEEKSPVDRKLLVRTDTSAVLFWEIYAKQKCWLLHNLSCSQAKCYILPAIPLVAEYCWNLTQLGPNSNLSIWKSGVALLFSNRSPGVFPSYHFVVSRTAAHPTFIGPGVLFNRHLSWPLDLRCAQWCENVCRKKTVTVVICTRSSHKPLEKKTIVINIYIL